MLPDFIFHLDETVIPCGLEKCTSKVIVFKIRSSLLENPSKWEHMTMVLCVSGCGESGEPFVILPLKDCPLFLLHWVWSINTMWGTHLDGKMRKAWLIGCSIASFPTWESSEWFMTQITQLCLFWTYTPPETISMLIDHAKNSKLPSYLFQFTLLTAPTQWTEGWIHVTKMIYFSVFSSSL